MKKLLTNAVTSVSKVLTSGKIGITNSEEVQRVKLTTSQYNVFLFQCDVIEVVLLALLPCLQEFQIQDQLFQCAFCKSHSDATTCVHHFTCKASGETRTELLRVASLAVVFFQILVRPLLALCRVLEVPRNHI